MRYGYSSARVTLAVETKLSRVLQDVGLPSTTRGKSSIMLMFASKVIYLDQAFLVFYDRGARRRQVQTTRLGG